MRETPSSLSSRCSPRHADYLPIGKEGMKDSEELASRLRRALHEIRIAYPTLIHRLEMAIFAAFDIDEGIVAARRSLPVAPRNSPPC